MKSRADRGAMEAALSDVWRAALAEACATLGVPATNWAAVPPLRSIVEALALKSRREHLQRVHGWSQERAEIEAGKLLGFNDESVSRRVREWLEKVYRSA